MCGSVGTDASSATCYVRERAHAGRVAPHLALPPAISGSSGAGKGGSGEEGIKSRKGPGAPRPWSRVPADPTHSSFTLRNLLPIEHALRLLFYRAPFFATFLRKMLEMCVG